MMNAMPLVRRQMKPMTTATSAPTTSAARKLHPAVLDAVVREDAHRVRADADVHRMTEAHQPAVAQDQVEAHRREREDHDAREQRDVERLADRRRDHRHEGEPASSSAATT